MIKKKKVKCRHFHLVLHFEKGNDAVNIYLSVETTDLEELHGRHTVVNRCNIIPILLVFGWNRDDGNVII